MTPVQTLTAPVLQLGQFRVCAWCVWSAAARYFIKPRRRRIRIRISHIAHLRRQWATGCQGDEHESGEFLVSRLFRRRSRQTLI